MTTAESFRSRLENLRKAGVRPGLDSIRALLDSLGNPQRSLKFVHVAGTNGKGATSAMIDSMLRAAGYRIARYTSPHLLALNERFSLCGEPIGDEALEAIADELFAAVEKTENAGHRVTYFECLTAAAFMIFRDYAPDLVVLEAGLGGRNDATNVIDGALVSVITHVGLDHCEWLGSTHGAIAEEKAGILRTGHPVVCGMMPESARDTIARFASLHGCEFITADEHVAVESSRPLKITTAFRNPPPIDFSLEGDFEVDNALTALTTVDVLCRKYGFHVSNTAVKTGLEKVVWPGRFHCCERDGVKFIVDGAHNPDGSIALRDSLRAVGRPLAFVCGFCGDKDVLANLRILSAVSTVGWAVPLVNSRSLPPPEVVERMMMAGFTAATACRNLDEGFAAASEWARRNEGTVVVCGSLFLAGEALSALGEYPWKMRAADTNEFFAP